MRLGIFGGSFDPIHYGHLLLAECCRDEGPLDEIWFVPAAMSPHKQDRPPGTGGPARAEMIRLAISGHRPFLLSTLELDRGGVSYTVDTLETIHAQRPDDQLFLLLGADALADFPNWKSPARICQLATPLVVARPTAPAPDLSGLLPLMDHQRWRQVQRRPVAMPQVEISSREIRARVARGQTVRFRLPRAVEEFIIAQQLYGSPPPA